MVEYFNGYLPTSCTGQDFRQGKMILIMPVPLALLALALLASMGRLGFQIP